MGEPPLSAVLQVLFQKLATPAVTQYFDDRKLTHRHLNKLDATIISCTKVVDDAVEKQLSQPSVKKWLNELKDAVFQAEDLLDKIAFVNLRSKLEAESSRRKLKDFVSSYSPHTQGIRERLKEILKRLHYLVKQKDLLGIRENTGEQPSSLKIATTSVANESSFYGRNKEKEDIICILISNDAIRDALSVIPIVGMGGLGKTALAQVVYNDSRVQDWFALKVWVFVHEDFDVFEITKDFLKEVSPDVTCDAKTHNQIQLELKQKLKGRRFLLVLDNVWNVNYADWDFLRRPLKSGAPRRKILVTTRNETVASIMYTVPSHRLNELKDEDCWCLFAKHAFDDGDSDVHPELKAIGKELVRKCNGSPLAAKILGGLLHCHRNVREWEKILENDMWNFTTDSIVPVLKVSYNHLPPRLKRCFVYCTIFPKKYEFEKTELILLWMAEDLLQYSEGKALEEFGKEYFDELVSRSFFQSSKVHQSRFIMHDFINDMAKFIAGEVATRMKDDGSCAISKRTRYLSYERS